uniref:Uncharacterized protein n=1 Tax=Fagus sylvatica TaxID=28930 RepID=A0A2N9FA17_FAGSY
MTRGGLLESPSPPPHRLVTPPPLRDVASSLGRTPSRLRLSATPPHRSVAPLRASALGTDLGIGESKGQPHWLTKILTRGEKQEVPLKRDPQRLCTSLCGPPKHQPKLPKGPQQGLHHNTPTLTKYRSEEETRRQPQKARTIPAGKMIHRGLKYTSGTSQTEDSQRIIANLRQEVSDLKREARGWTPIKEKPRNRVNASKRGYPEYSNYKESPDTSSSWSDSSSSTPQEIHRKSRSLGESSRFRLPLYGRKNPQSKKQLSTKTPRPEEQNAVWRALDLVSSSPFSREIEKARLPKRFTAPRFETYNGRTDPVSHIGHYQQTMTVRKAREMDALLTMKLQDSETIKNYSIRYWETYNDIDGRSEEVAIKAFKLGLPVDSGLRHSLVKRQPSSLVKLMNKIDQFVRLEEYGKGATPAETSTQPKVCTPKHPAPVRPNPAVKSLSGPKDFAAPSFRAFGTVFKESIYRLIEKIKREPFFAWPPKLIGNPDSRDSKLYCNYHKDTGHMTENCHKLKVHLEHLATEGHLDQYIDTKLSKMKGPSATAGQPNTSDTIAAEIIHVIHDPLCSIVSTGSYRAQIQKAAHLRRSFSVINSVHPAPICSVRGGATEQVISFSDSDLKDVQLPHNDPLVVTLRIGNYDVERILIDQGSFAEVMYQDLYIKLGMGEAELSNFASPIFGFSGEPVMPLGKAVLPVLAGPDEGHPVYTSSEAKIPNKGWGHGIKRGSGGKVLETKQPEKVFFDPSNPEKFFLVGSKLSAVEREQLLEILISNQDVFAWSVYDAPGVSPGLACHSLNIGSEHRPIVQKRRKLASEMATTILEEVGRLLTSGAIREIQYPVWLSNTVVVKKKNGKWRVCIDFTDLNKACPKDPFPLPRIDQMVDSASGHARLSFLDAFQGYHQIPMNEADQNKTAFITPRGTYCYKMMLFGLKNAGATYQRMVTKMFEHIIGKTVEVYIDNMLVKSLHEEDHIVDLLQVFDILRESRLRLNASKCTFGVSSGKFLGHVVSRRGIEPNPDQIAALVDSAEPRNIKQVQRLTGMIAALGRFISRSADKCKPFFRLLGKRSKFVWDGECSAAFQGIKAYLSTPPCLLIPNQGEQLFLYLAVSDHAVSAVLVREFRQEQKPVFFVSKAMDEIELRYLPLEKAALAVLQAAKKLPHYFQSNKVTVLSDLPLKMLLQRSDFSGRITKWGVYLGSLGVEYQPRAAIKGQVLAEFLAEFQSDPNNPSLTMPVEAQLGLAAGKWELFVNGASNSKGSGAGVVLVSPEGLILEQAVRLKFSASNNEAEYEALLIGLRTAERLGACHLQVFCDSQLVANQVSGEYQARDERMSAYLATVRLLMDKFESVHVAQIGREHNSHADILAKLATALESEVQRTVCIKTLDRPSFQGQTPFVCSVSRQPSWMDPILSYLVDNKLPEDKKEAKMIKRKAPKYWVSKEGSLYRRSFTGPYLLCVRPEMTQNFLFEIHEGICGSHTGGRSLAHRAISQGYWWPYMQADALKYVRECDKCQRFAPMIHQPAIELNPLSSPWPFAQWGLDIVGPLPRAPGNKKFLITATDYFTKWIEAEPLSNIRDVDTKRFFWKNVITRFGIPWAAISDNGTQFESRLFKGFCSNLGIKNFFSSPGYPQSNGQAEASNKIVLSGIKRKLEEAKGKWVEELPSVLWTHRTTARRSTGETPFALAYGVEAVIPLEVGIPTIRTTNFTVQSNEDNLRKDLDLLEERRDMATVRLASYHQRIKKEHDKNISHRVFRIRDLVLRKVMANTRKPNEGKLGPNWEGPYKVISPAGAGSYRLEDLEGKPIPRPWNTCNLRKYFF